MTTFNFNPNHVAEENILRLEEKFFELEKMLQRGLAVQRKLAAAVLKVTVLSNLSKDERAAALADLATQTVRVNSRVRLLARRVQHLDMTIQTLREFVEA